MNSFRNLIPEAVLEVLQQLHMAGFEAWIVGGAIRTLLMNQKPHDWDLTTNATPDQVRHIFPKAIDTGVAFGTVTVIHEDLPIQITTFRKEGEYENHRKPKQVTFATSLFEDLSRRDFTMNAIAYDPLEDVLEDPFEGQSDIKYEVIQTVGNAPERFEEDALRILRALRFQSQLGFHIDPVTLDGMISTSHLIQNLSRERIGDEFTKWITGPFLSKTRDTCQLIQLFNIFSVQPSPALFRLWDHLPLMGPGRMERFIAFFCLYADREAGERDNFNLLNLLQELRLSTAFSKKVVESVEFFFCPVDLKIQELRHVWLKKALKIGFAQAQLILKWKSELTSYKPPILLLVSYLHELSLSRFEQKVTPLAITGDDVMEIFQIKPGKDVKKALDVLQNYVLDNPDDNQPEQLKKVLQKVVL